MLDIDFFSAVRAPAGSSGKMSQVTAACVCLVGVCAAALAGAFLYTVFADISVRGQIAEKRSYLGNSRLIAAAADVSRNTARTQALQKYASLASQNIRAYRGLTSFDPSLLNAVTAALPKGGRINHFDYADPMVRIGCTVQTADDVANYVQRLRAAGRFSSVRYSGFNWSAAGYAFDVQCTMKGGGPD